MKRALLILTALVGHLQAALLAHLPCTRLLRVLARVHASHALLVTIRHQVCVPNVLPVVTTHSGLPVLQPVLRVPSTRSLVKALDLHVLCVTRVLVQVPLVCTSAMHVRTVTLVA